MNKRRRKAAASRGTCPTIGFLLPTVTPPYHAPLWTGVAEAAREQGVRVICFTGGTLAPEGEIQDPRNMLYDWVSEENVDGLVISATVGNFVTPERFRNFVDRYSYLPRVVIGEAIPGVHHVLIDNEMGMREALIHLIEDHGYRRIAFIRGPEDNEEANLRYQVYVDVLSEYDLPFDPDLVAPGAFVEASGREAIRLFRDERKLDPGKDFDVLASASDNMVIGALRELQARGFRVPGDVALMGFDDVEVASMLTPSLTTVRQPPHEMGKRALEMLVGLLNDEEVPERVVLPTQLVTRRSCGCMESLVTQAAIGEIETTNASLGDVFAAQRENILADIERSVEEVSAYNLSELTDLLVESFVADLEGKSLDSFLVTLEEILRQAALAGGSVEKWHAAISVLRQYATPCLNNGALSKAQDLWNQARVVIAKAARRAQARQALQSERRLEALRQAGQNMIATSDMDDLVDVLIQELPRMRMNHCYLSLYDQPEAPMEQSQLILAYDKRRGGKIDVAGPRHFPTPQLVPAGVLSGDRRCRLVLEPLYYEERHIGFVLLGAESENDLLYAPLREEITSAVQSIILTQRAAHRALQLQTAAEVSRSASSILDSEELIPQTVNLIRERFDLYYVGLFLVDESGEWTGEPGRWAVLRAGTGEAGEAMMAAGHKLEVGGESLIGQCVANQEARIALDVGQAAVRFDNPHLPDTHSEMALPLISRGQAVGALSIQSTERAAFSEEDIVILQTMVSQVATAIENTRLLDQTQEALAEMEATQRRYLQRAWSEFERRLAQKQYEIARPGAAPVNEEFAAKIQAAMAAREPQVIRHDDEEGPARSVLIVPSLLRGELVGGVTIEDNSGEREWTDDEIALMEAVAERMAMVAENLRLLDESQRRAARERLTSEITSRMRESLNIDTILQTAIREMGEGLGIAEVEVQMESEE